MRVEPRLALLFLTRGMPHQERVWQEFMDEAVEKPRVIVHAKEPGCLRGGIFKDALRVPTLETRWGDVSLVRATLRLMRAALEESDASHLALVSESCVPVMPCREMLRRLAMDGRSRIDWQPLETMARVHRDRFQTSAGILPSQWRVHPQWMLVTREVAEWLVSEDVTGRFKKVFAADEHYFGTLLEMMGYPLEERILRQPSTWVQWGPGVADGMDRNRRDAGPKIGQFRMFLREEIHRSLRHREMAAPPGIRTASCCG